MGDHGKRYQSFTEEHCEKMKELVKKAHILTPNITEACILTNTPYKTNWSEKEIEEICKKLQTFGVKLIIITGVFVDGLFYNYIKDGEAPITVIKEEKVGENRPGTGDIFTSIVMGSVMNHQTVISGVKKASHFVKQCIEQSERWKIPIEDGVCFEEFLYTL